MKLSPSQLFEFQRDGFLVLRNFANSVLCDMIKDIAIVHLKYKIPPIESESDYIGDESDSTPITVRRLRQVYGRDIVFKSWMQDESIRDILEQVLDDKPVVVLAHHNSIMTKMPHTSTQTSWHQDIRYWSYESDNLVSVWLALDEEYEANGVLEFIAGSHKMKFSKEQFEDKIYFSSTHTANQELIRAKTSVKLHKGDVVLFHCKLLHRANKNSTDSAKISFVYTVKGAKNRAIEGSRSASYSEIVL